MRLGKHFQLREFLRSETAQRMGRHIEQPPDAVVAQLRRLVVNILDPLREQIGLPIMILSGWRPLWLNSAVGGSRNSDHMSGNAADILVAGMSTLRTCMVLQESKWPIKQCIHEFPPNGWVHVSIAPGGTPKREFLTATKEKGRTVYTPGL